MRTETIDQLAVLGNRTTGAGAGLGVYGWLTSSQFIGLAGVVIALIGVLINWHYKAKAHRRSEAEHELRMSLLRSKQHITDLGELGSDD
jgi:hypothetical protein